MNEEEDHLYMGDVVVSFRTVIFNPASIKDEHGLSLGCVFLLSSGNCPVIKFGLVGFNELRDEVEMCIRRFPEIDQRAEFYQALSQLGSAPLGIGNIFNHPIAKYLSNIPNPPRSANETLANQYVKVVHLNAYPDVFKFDFTFVTEHTARYTIPSSLIPYLAESFDSASSRLSSLNNF